MEIITAILSGIIQGITEFLPISSSTHLMLYGAFVGKNITESILNMANLGTLFAIMFHYRKKISKLHYYLFLNMSIAFAVTVVFYLLFKKLFFTWKSDPIVTGLNYIIFGGLLLASFFKQEQKQQKGAINLFDVSLKIILSSCLGLVQALAYFPGVSRMGITLTFLFFLGIEKKKAVFISFLMAIFLGLAQMGKDCFFLMKQSFLSFESLSFDISFLIIFLSSFIVGLFSFSLAYKILSKNAMIGIFVYRSFLGLFFLFSNIPLPI